VQVLGLGGADEARRTKANAVIERQVLHMVRLVDDLLDVSRITRGKINLQREPTDLDDVIARAVESCGPAIAARSIALEIETPDEALFVDGDGTRLVQVLTNILNNAVKYTDPRGRIVVKAERDADHVVLSVRDSGVGIAASSLPRVFDLFAQVPAAVDRLGGGLGIGLAIVRRLVEMHGGTVTAHSGGPGMGSEFTVRLPLLASPRPAAEPSPLELRKPAARRIVVADDNEDVLDVLAWMLESQGHEVHVARDGLEAVEAAATYRPDVVLLDLGMPRLDGYGAAHRIRAQPWGRAMKLIAQSGYGQESDKRKAMAAGFDLHLTKPIDLERLNSALASLEPSLVE
jgi:CheY-like chemotaxis protein/two-component sensor histidine kinase